MFSNLHHCTQSTIDAGSAMPAAAPPAQRLAVSSGSALDDIAVLDLVLRYVGAGQALYTRASAAMTRQIDTTGAAMCIRPSAFGAAFGSAARLRLACDNHCGLQLIDLHSWSIEKAAGKIADCSTLTLAHELGMPWDSHVMRFMVRYNRLPELQWLHIE
jgi:hypothetical protein